MEKQSKVKDEKWDISEDVLIAVYQAQWADIQHSRNQDWELSKTILIGFFRS